MKSPFYHEIVEQPEALRQLIAFYHSGEGIAHLNAIRQPQRALLTGMGASFHAGLYASYLYQSLGIPSLAVEATDLLHYSISLLEMVDLVMFISQSGSSGEVKPLLEQFVTRVQVVAVTNRLDSALAAGAQGILPQMAGIETTVATKTYLNTLACLWLLACYWQGRAESAFDRLTQLAAAAERLIADERVIDGWMHALSDAKQIIFLGHGPHIATARQAAMMLSEWAKLPAVAATIGAFRHGLIEVADSQTGFVVFGQHGITHESSWRLIDELHSYGAQVLVVSDGQLVSERQPNISDHDEFLAPLLDVIPAQLFAEAMARHLGIAPGFRYITKVVSQL